MSCALSGWPAVVPTHMLATAQPSLATPKLLLPPLRLTCASRSCALRPGEEPLPEDPPEGMFKSVAEPNQLDNMLLVRGGKGRGGEQLEEHLQEGDSFDRAKREWLGWLVGLD